MSERHLLLQLSDLHILPTGRLHSLGDPVEHLDRAIDLIKTSSSRPEAVLLTGDLTDAGDPAAYRMLRERIDGLCAATGAAAVFVPGNHDERSAFRTHLLGAPEDVGHESPIDQVHWFGDLRVISLDSVIPGEDAGSLSEAQLEWLASELASVAPDGTVIALHHPPIHSPISTMDRIGLSDPGGLARVLDGSDVRLIVAGHNHHASAGMLGPVPVWVSPALSYRSDAMDESRYVGLTGSAFTRIDVIDGSPLVTVVPVAPL
ncbi:MAG: metallophosphoesterase [Acidimicrobiales bacterium]